jgi:hypothetical protein
MATDNYRKQERARSEFPDSAPLLTGCDFVMTAFSYIRAIGTTLLIWPYLFCLCVAYLAKNSR